MAVSASANRRPKASHEIPTAGRGDDDARVLRARLDELEAKLAASEDKYRQAIDESLQGYTILSHNWEPIFINRAAVEIFGYDSAEELLALPTLSLLVAEHEHARLKGYSAARRRGEDAPNAYVTEGVRKDGSPVWTRNIINTIEWEGERAMQLVQIDVSAEVMAERALEDAKQRFQDYAESSADWFWETDENLRYTYITPGVTRVLGAPPESFYGQTRVETLPPDTDMAFWKQHLETMEAHEPFKDFAYARPVPGGETAWVRVTGKPRFDEDGRFLGYRGTGTDITELKRGEVELRRAKKLAEFANRSKSEFLAHMSHELRTPLNAILGFSEIIEKEMWGPVSPPRYADYVRDIHRSGVLLLDLINDVLDLSKIEAGRVELQEERVQIEKAIASCLRLVKERARQAGLELRTEIANDPPALMADERLVKQMLINLITNAIKFTPAGGKVTIRVRESEKDGLVVAVADTGEGIASDDLQMVLEPFAQSESAMVRSREGTGLGLSLVKTMIEMHGGRLTIESERGAGTTATLTFPPERVLAKRG